MCGRIQKPEVGFNFENGNVLICDRLTSLFDKKIHCVSVQDTWAKMRAAVAVSEPSHLTGTLQPSIDTPWVRALPSSNLGAEISNAIVSVGKGPQETLDRKLEIGMWEGAGADGGAQLHVHQALQEGEDEAEWHAHPLAPAPKHTLTTNLSPIHHTRTAERAAVAVSEPSPLTGTITKFIDTQWVCTHASTPE